MSYHYLCLFLLSICFSIASVQAKVTRRWPQDWTDATGWAGYGVYIGLSVLFPILFFIALYVVVFIVWKLRRCTVCGCPLGLLGGANPKSAGYSKPSVRISQAIFYCAFAIIS
jgi:hypothetical protein